jgi:hypothetical protein
MAVDETTHLLAKPAAGATRLSKTLNGKPNGETPKTFALWQIGALFGKKKVTGYKLRSDKLARHSTRLC